MRRLLAAVALLVTTALGAGCSGKACTQIGGDSALTVEVPPRVVAEADSLLVQLCQGGRCATTTSPVPQQPPGVFAYVLVYLDDLGDGDWEAGPVRVLLSPRSEDGERSSDTRIATALVERRPNGEGCDPVVLGRTVQLGR